MTVSKNVTKSVTKSDKFVTKIVTKKLRLNLMKVEPFYFAYFECFIDES